MNNQIAVDGCVYNFVHENNALLEHERIVVTDADGNFIGEVEFIHASECANVRRENGDVDGVYYHEFLNKNHETIAKWIVCTSY